METDTDAETDFDFFKVAKSGSFTVLDLALTHLEIYDFAINSQDLEGNTLLHYASLLGNEEITKKILSLSAGVDARNKKGETPLHLACLGGHLAVARTLLGHGADCNSLDHQKESPLFKSVREENRRLTKYLISQHSKVSIANIAKEKLLHLAVKFKDRDLVEVLLESGEDPNNITASGDFPIQLAVKTGNIQIFNVLKKKRANLKVTDGQKRTLLHMAVLSDQENILKALVSLGLDVNLKDCNGSTALHLAVELRLISIVTFLLSQKNIDINCLDEDWYTPLHVAAGSQDDCDILKLLLKHGVRKDVQTCHGDLPLHIAAAKGFVNNFMALFDEKHNIIENKLGLIPLQMELFNGKSELDSFLSEKRKISTLKPKKITKRRSSLKK